MRQYSSLILLVLILFCAGFLVQYSSSVNNDFVMFNKHLFFFLFSIPLGVIFVFTPLKTIVQINRIAYLISILILVFVLIIGKTAMGATRWFTMAGISIQPSEFVKISVILIIADYFSLVKHWNLNRLIYFLPPVGLFLLPVLLILLQPNLGTAMIICLISGSMIMAIFPRLKLIALGLLLFVISVPFIWKFGLHDYQKQRVLTFLDPESEPSGAGYNIIQSKIAVGSGGVFGNGYLKGTQSKLDFLPEKHTDFVFSLFSEEFGFLITCGLIFAYIWLIFKILAYSIQVDDIYQKLILIGCNAMIFWHLVVNTFMSMDLIPVVGVPMPFLSYGRSFLLSNMIIIGLIFNILRTNNKRLSN
jgi:rod shape determining protein RodA